MLRRLIILLLVSLFVVGEVAPSLTFAQDDTQQQQPVKKKRKTLLDFLFGGGDDQEQELPPPVQKPVVTVPKKGVLPQPKAPAVEKSPTAVRLAVFGDSMAVDLAAALDRLYADDPNINVINQGVGSSSFVRPDYFDWNKTATEQVAANSFDLAVVIIGINDRQTLKVPGDSFKSLTPEWTNVYQTRVHDFVQTLRTANKPVIWIGLPPMSKADFSAAMGQISSIQRLATFSGGGEFLDIYDRFVDDDGAYTSFGPDLNGNRVRIRKDDGIHFTAAGADKLAFYASQSIKLYYHGGSVGIDVADALAGTDAGTMVRPPYQGLGQIRLLEVAGAVISLTHSVKRSADLVTADTAAPPAANDNAGFDLNQLVEAPVGRADAFGVGKDLAAAVPEAAAQ